MCVRKGVYTCTSRTQHRHRCTHARTHGGAHQASSSRPMLSCAMGFLSWEVSTGPFGTNVFPSACVPYVNKPGSPWKGLVRFKLVGPRLRGGLLSLSISSRAVARRRPPSPQLHLPPPHSALRGISPRVVTFYINTDGFQDNFANRYLRQMLLAARFPWKLPQLNYPESASPEDVRALRMRRFIQGGRAARVRGRGAPSSLQTSLHVAGLPLIDF